MNKLKGGMRPEYRDEELGKGVRGKYLLPAVEAATESRRSMPATVRPLMERDNEVMNGALCFAGTRVPVKHLFDYLEGSSSLDDFLQDFPSVSREHAVAVLEAAHQCLAADAPVPDPLAPANR